MSAPVKKEIRLLLPAWVAAMLLAIAPVWILGNLGAIYYANFTMVPDFCFVFGAILLGIASFGQEFGSGAFTLLLSQPVERRRFWLVKTAVLAGAFVSVFLAYLVSRRIHFELYGFAHYLTYYEHRSRSLLLSQAVKLASAFWGKFSLIALYAFAIFSSGLWTTLLLRRTSEAFWLTLLTPLAITVAVGTVLDNFVASNRIINVVIEITLALYAIAGFFWARRLFLRAQDVEWTGGDIAFPSRKRISERIMVSDRRRRWFSALVWKELQLHQVNILIAGLILALHLASVVIRKVHSHFADPIVLGILEQVWVLWLLMPLLIGSAAIAEEHRLGVIASQFCLPVSRRAQFGIKFFVGLILSLLLGGLMPFIIERAREFNDLIFVAAAAIFFISFYASTLAPTTLQAIGLAIVVAGAICFYEVATFGSVFTRRVGLELLKLFLGVPTLLLVLGGLIYWNFKWLHPMGKLRWRNGLTILASFAFIFVVTNGIYFRAWEWLTPIESP
ncbi:MAG: hypothetical protein ACREDS_12045, partial [Limisphaerales bacterium]